MLAPHLPQYAEWRLERGLMPLLRDAGDCPPEKLLQTIWQHQRLVRDRLATLDGVSVRVLHPGFQNLSGGPDFQDAVVQFGVAPPVSGDVEVDLRSSGWRAHGHDRNPAFGKVILHVVWESEREAPGVPATLCLSRSLDAPVGELSLWLSAEPERPWPAEFLGKCSTMLCRWPREDLAELLRQAGCARLQGKAAQFRARARQAGWEQALWEGAFRALGYRHNSWPMQRLGELRGRWSAAGGDVVSYQSRLLGLGGLLPNELTRARRGADDFVRRLWDEWWRERDEFADSVLPLRLWRFHGLRPANHPHRRLALAAHWATRSDLAGRLEHWCSRKLSDSGLPETLFEELQAPPDEFWDWHWTLRSAKLGKRQSLLGSAWVTEFAVNVVLPWLWARASQGKNDAMREEIEQRYHNWPAGQDNAVLRHARQRLLGGLSSLKLQHAAVQQGLIQIVRDFCDHSDSVCAGCRFPLLVQRSGQ